MSTATEVSRLTSARNTIRDKLIAMGLAASADKLDALASAIDGISIQGAVSATVQEGATYTIPAGYHNGSGTVSGIAGGGNYGLQSKNVTPTKSQQSITPDSGYYGLSDVTVAAIPEAYQNVSAVTATASELLSPKVFVNAQGSSVVGTMVNNGAVSKVLDATTNNQSYTVPSGFHNGSGSVAIVLEEKSVNPSDMGNVVVIPTAGKVLSKVTVTGIPQNYVTIDDATAVASHLLSGEIAYTNAGTSAAPEPSKITGTMANRGALNVTLDPSGDYTVNSGYYSGGTLTVATTSATVTPSSSTQTLSASSESAFFDTVKINPIPSGWYLTSDANAVASNLLAGTSAYGSAGKINGSMVDRGSLSASLSPWSDSVTLSSGFYSGGTITVAVSAASDITPSSSTQYFDADAYFFDSIVVHPIPSGWYLTSDADAVASQLLNGMVAYGSGGKITGTMANNSAISGTINGLTTTSYTVPSGYTSGGTVSLTSDIEDALAAI